RSQERGVMGSLLQVSRPAIVGRVLHPGRAGRAPGVGCNGDFGAGGRKAPKPCMLIPADHRSDPAPLCQAGCHRRVRGELTTMTLVEALGPDRISRNWPIMGRSRRAGGPGRRPPRTRRPAMDATRQSLLLRAQAGDEGAWQDLCELYRPLIVGWLRRQAVTDGDLDDLV